jgi:Ca2+-binding RTX toxin-like protein
MVTVHASQGAGPPARSKGLAGRADRKEGIMQISRPAGRGFARLGVTATAFVIAAAGLAATTDSPAFAVVPVGCGPYSGSAPPAGYNAVNMTALGINVYNSGGGPDFVVGTLSADVITLSGANDIVCGRDGADFIDAGGGEDIVYAAGGADEVYGGLGEDFISGGQGGDLLVGDLFAGPSASDGDDEIHGGQGNDDIFGYNGNDDIFGGTDVGGADIDNGDGGGGADTCDADVENPTSC